MKTTVLTAALLAAFAIPAFADDAAKPEDTAKMTPVDPTVTRSVTAGQSDMRETTVKDGYSGCMRRKTTLNMM